MPHSAIDPALTVALALLAGVLAQSVGRHLRIPGIVLLLAAGVALGPDALGLIAPVSLGSALETLVGFAVAVILFEGGLNLNLSRLRREARNIRQLVTVGALTTALGGTLAARLVLGWDWIPSILFGTLVIVTGPTVIQPLLRRIKVQQRVATVLEAEAVMGDAIGAIVAVVALEVSLRPSGLSLARGMWSVASRLGFGFAAGLGAGLLIALLLRLEKAVPEGLENILTLAATLALYQGSNFFVPESGLVAVIVAGVVVGNVKTPVLRQLLDFKEQLTVLLIGMIFVLLAADVRFAQVRALGAAGLWTVAALMFIVRPLTVIAGTYGTSLTVREKIFLSWTAPRGIVAAAVSSLFAETMRAEGIPGGAELQAMVFLVIGATVLVAGLTGGPVARLLGVRRPSDTGYAIVGANDLGRALARVLRDSGEETVLIDSNPEACQAAESEGLRVLYGSALSESILLRAELDTRAGAIAATANDEVNMLFARRARKRFKVARAWIAIRRGQTNVTPRMAHEVGARVLFGAPRSTEYWIVALERSDAAVEAWTRSAEEPVALASLETLQVDLEGALLPLAVGHGKKVLPADEETAFRKEDRLYALIHPDRAEAARSWLRQEGWTPEQAESPESREAAPTPIG